MICLYFNLKWWFRKRIEINICCFIIIEEIESNDINGKFVYICVFVWYYNVLLYYIYFIKDVFYMIKIILN